MFVIHGRYHWFPKRTAFRNDHCLACEGERIAVRVRTLDVFHLFWIPLLPLGLWSRWFCSDCGRRPSHPKRTRKPFKVAGLVLLLIAVATFWLAPFAELDPDLDPAFLWTFRVLTVLAVPLVMWNLARSPPDVSYRAMRRAVEPYRDTTCPFCRGPLVLRKVWECPVCGMERAER